VNYHPNSELVTCAWISSISGFPLTASNGVMTQAPKQEQWPVIDGVSQIVTCRVVGGTPNPVMDVPVAMPVMEIKAWATKLNQNRPPWFIANELIELIRIACYQKSFGVFGRALTIQANNVPYNQAIVLKTQVHAEPRRLYSDPRNYAVYTMDVGFVWKEVNLVIAGN
jgi:hypothetical protein